VDSAELHGPPALAGALRDPDRVVEHGAAEAADDGLGVKAST
jgi:hypothetical protein